MTKINICPEDEISLLLPAKEIPHGSKVSKRTGEARMTLAHNLTLHRSCDATEGSITVRGFFLIDGANINRIVPETILQWHVSAEDFVELLQTAWEGTPQ